MPWPFFTTSRTRDSMSLAYSVALDSHLDQQAIVGKQPLHSLGVEADILADDIFTGRAGKLIDKVVDQLSAGIDNHGSDGAALVVDHLAHERKSHSERLPQIHHQFAKESLARDRRQRLGNFRQCFNAALTLDLTAVVGQHLSECIRKAGE